MIYIRVALKVNCNKFFKLFVKLFDFIIAKSLLHKVMDLPIQKYRDDIVSAVVSNRLIIVTGGTGCGKSTMVPYYLWKEKQLFNGTPRILM